MNYLPILEELSASDSIVFLVIGMIIALLIGRKLKRLKKNAVALILCLGVYAASEIVSNLRTDFLWELIFLLIGTLALGGVLGFLIKVIVMKFKG